MKLVLQIALAALVAVAVASPQYSSYGGQAQYSGPGYGSPGAASGLSVYLPEVEAVKAAHLGEQAQARRQNGAPGAYNQYAYNPGAYNPGAYNQGAYNPGAYNQGAYNQGAYNPGAYNQGAYNPAPYNAAPAYNQYNPAPYGHGQFGPGGLPQPPQDTPEVAAAKAAHLRAHAAAGSNPHYG